MTENSNTNTTDYAGNYIYKDGSLEFFNHPEGYVEPDVSGYSYVYQYKDHLGNIRLSYDLDETNSIIINEDYSGLIYNWQTPNDINTTYYNLNNETLNFTSTEKWRSISKYVDFVPNETIHIEFDFEKGSMVNPILFVREKINGVWESNADRDRFELTDGHFEVDLNLQGDHIRIYFEKGAGSDEGIPTTSHIDNLIITQNIIEIVEENNYYPFGLKHKGYNNVINGTDHPYGFGGKEEQDELGLGWIDITARNYDPALGRWMNLDPLAEQMRRHSPYNYAFDNPIYWIDPDGLSPQACPSCNSEEDWEAYYSQGYNTAAQLGVLESVTSGDYTLNWIQPNDRLTTTTNEDGRTIFHLDGEVQDLDRHDSRLDALSSIVSDALNPEAPNKLFKYIAKFFKSGGDDAAKSSGSIATKVFDDSTELVEGLEFSGTISSADGVMNVEIEMLQKVSEIDANANLITALETMAENNGMSEISIVGHVVNEAAAAKASVEYIKAGYNISTRTTKTGMTELLRTKKFE